MEIVHLVSWMRFLGNPWVSSIKRAAPAEVVAFFYSQVKELRNCILIFPGPVTAVLINTFGCRTITITGTFVCFTGLILSVFATSIFYLCLSFGVLGGLGMSMMMLPLNVITVQCFHKHRTIATGLWMTGSGVGTVVFNPLSKWLIDEYGWRGSLLIEAGLLLNCLICGLQMRPPVKQPSKQGPSTKYKVDASTAECVKFIEQQHTSPPLSDRKEDSTQEIRGPLDIPAEEFEILNRSKGANKSSAPAVEAVSQQNNTPNNIIKHTEERHNCGLLIAIVSGVGESFSHLKKLMDVPFLVLLFASFTFGTFYSTPFTYLPDLAVVSGHDRTKATALMTAIGISNTIGRATAGIIGDCRCVYRPYMIIGARAAIGSCLILLPYTQDFAVMMCVCVVLGYVIATQNVLEFLTFCDLFGDEAFADALGLMCLTIGFGGTIGAPFAGFLFDVTGYYDPTFVISGCGIVISGLLIGVIVAIQRLRARRK